MQTRIECFPCFLKQVIIAVKQISFNEALFKKVLHSVLPLINNADLSKPPAYTTTFIHRAIRHALGTDPFRKVKYEYNNIAMGLYPKFREMLISTKDPLWTAARLAIAGNVIDFGIFTSIDIESSVNRALEKNIAVDDYPAFKQSIQEAGSILYLLDNAGEIVFDRLLIEELVSSGKQVTAVVKGAPVLNDVTYEDALQTGLTGVCQVIDNGSDAVGTILEWTSSEFQKTFGICDLIISKGQGNFETIPDTGKRAYFLFQSKCDVVSKELNLSPCSMLLKKS